MVELSDQRLDAALAFGEILHKSEPRAAKVHYDEAAHEIVVNLTNGSTFRFPPKLVQGLEGASAGQLSDVEILGAGYGLHWESLDVDFTVPGLLAGIFGTKSYLAKLGGQSRSPAKALASKANGMKGGRPRKIASL